MGLRDHRHHAEVEAVERLGRIEARFDAMPFDAPFHSLGEFVLEQRTKQPRGLPALLVGALGKLGP